MVRENTENSKLEQQNRRPNEGGILDPQVILSLLIKNWYWFVAATIVALFCARLYLGHTLPVYETSATILINEKESESFGDNKEILKGLGLPGGMQNLENQIMILKSRELTDRTLKELPFEIDYYFKTVRNQLPIYPAMPIEVLSENSIPLPKNTEFSISFLGNNKFYLESNSKYFSLQKTASFGEIIEIASGSFRIESRDTEWIKENGNQKLYFNIFSRNNLINNYIGRIGVELISKGGSILKISLLGTNPAKDVDFINRHLDGFQSISLDKKNVEAERRIQFIDGQLVGVSDSLSMTENRLQQFRSTHKVMDLSAQGQAIIGQVTLLENEKARLSLEANYYDYLKDYLSKDVSSGLPIIPITMGITDPGLTRLVAELAELQGQLAAKGAGEMNPLQRNLEQRARSTKDALRETLNGLQRANSLARSENQEQINKANSQASSLPVTERQLLGIERKFKLNDELYTFLLETRAEQQMQKASNRSDSEIIDRADERFSFPVSPDPTKIYSFGLFAGLLIPFLIIFLKFVLNNTLKEEDISRMSDIPVVGSIPHNDEKINTVVFESPNSSLAEAFRILRSRVQFLTKEEVSPVILITSTMPEDGKTFTAVNLASVYSLLGKKTVLVGFDMRKPKIYNDFNLNNETGVSTWLIGKSNLEDIIQKTAFDNLYVISAGPIPPNPSELTALEKTKELIRLLKQRYDYIVIDSSPIGVVSDTFYLGSLADACLLVVRSNKTLKDMFEKTINEIEGSALNSVSIVINDIQSRDKQYGYGEKYGYTSDKERKKIRILKRKGKK